jgi:hypothetical protein
MFVQVMEGRVGDLDGLRRQLDTWVAELAPGAEGWLGTTAGVTADGTFIAVVRFDSQEAADANGDRPEQGAWWSQTEGTFDGDVSFTNCPEVDTFGAGGSDDAGFVQIMLGRGDRSVIVPLATELEEMLTRMRPDVMGGTVAWPGDGRFVQTVYFTSEAEARKAETAEPSPEDGQAGERMGAAMEVERFVDLSDPWLYSR